MKSKKRLVIIVALAAVVALGAFIWARMAGRTEAPSYLTETVHRGDVERTVLASGTLQPFEVVDVGAQASGQIQTLNVALGDRVTEGQILAVIDPANQRNTLRTGEAQISQQKAQLAAQAATLLRDQQNLTRQQTMLQSGYIAQTTYEQAQTQVAVDRANMAATQAAIQQAQVSIDRARVDLGRTSIVAPISGVISDIVVRKGQTVNAVQTAPTIVRIAKMDVMTVKAQISEADVINVAPGQSVYFTILGDPDRRYYAALRQIEPAPPSTGNSAASSAAASAAAVYYNALFDVPNPDGRLRASMTAQVNVVLGAAKSVLVVPSSALTKEGGAYSVKVMDAAGAVASRKVTVGLNNNVVAQVKSGLAEGEKVVVGEMTKAQAAAQMRAAQAANRRGPPR
jgi:macrolide-specific efflux system membrane fusion protein